MIEFSGLDVEGLSLWRGGRALFEGVSFSVRPGDTLALEGPNGAGKTSLLRAIAGFLVPQAGSIRIKTKNGRTLDGGEERAPCIGWLGHQDGAKSQMTPEESLRFFARYYGGSGDSRISRIDEALTRLDLQRLRDLPIQFLSAGQKRRLALARLWLNARPLWLLDEPFATLDEAGKGLVSELVAAHCRESGAAIVATHEPLGLPGPELKLGRAA